MVLHESSQKANLSILMNQIGCSSQKPMWLQTTLDFKRSDQAYIHYSVAVMNDMNRFYPPAEHVVELKI